MTSDTYKRQSPVRISNTCFARLLFYATGMSNTLATNITVEQAKQMLIKQALQVSTNPDEVIDYMCEVLMSRVSNAQENNMLSHKFNNALALSDENKAWMLVVNEIIKLPDVSNK